MDTTFHVGRIVIPIDFSDTSRRAFYVGLRLARQYDAFVDVLHVVEPIASFDTGEDIQRQAGEMDRIQAGVRRRVDELFEDGGLAEVDRRKVRVDIRAGKPYLEICRYAWEQKADLIVLGSHGYTGVKHMLLGSQTEKVVRRAHCMVLTIKPEHYEVDADISGRPAAEDAR